MKVSVFSGKGGVYGFTDDKTGAKLPSDHGPWKHFKDMDINEVDKPRITVSSKEIIADIGSKGYHLAKPGFQFSAS